MAKLGTKNKPAIVKVQTEEKAMQIMALCDQKGWQVIVGIEPEKDENLNDIEKLLNSAASLSDFKFKSSPSRNAPCPCGSGKLYKRCCGR